MHVFRSATLCLLLAFVGGCSSGDAFVDRNYMQKSIKKQKLPGYDGSVSVCYSSDTPRTERDKLAAEACEVYGLKAALSSDQRWQCRFTVPHLARYICYNPDMRMANGALVNPFSPAQVKKWKGEQAQIKGQRPQASGALPEFPGALPEFNEPDGE